MRKKRWWDPLAAALLVIALLTATGRLIATEWVEHLSLVYTLVILGTAAGLALGQSTFPPVLAFLVAATYGAFAVPWQLGRTVAHLSDDALWGDRMVVLASRLMHTLVRFVQQEPVHDPALFLFAMAALGWTLSVHAGYALTRRASPWRVIVPPGLAALLIQTSDLYRPRGIWYLAGYFLFALTLVARVTFLRLRRDWEADHARVPPLIGLDLSYAMVGVVVVLILLAWSAPTMADVLPAAKEIWDRATAPLERRSEKLFASLRRQGPTITAADYYGEEFSLGRGRELSDGLVASVQAPPPGPGVRYYWRARAYDNYEDGRWQTEALTVTEQVRPGSQTLRFPPLEGRRTLTFTFTSPDPLMTLYVPPQPREVSRRATFDLAVNPDGTVDVASVHASPPLGAGETYVVRSSIADVTISELRDAGTEYPAWITERYLDVPPTVTDRTRGLAEQIAAEAETSYDTVAAVTRYLRANIEYSETITETRPEEQEPLDWFLFDTRVGFCNYYASSEVILLRVLGIPARLAVGFAEGEHQRGTSTYLVLEKNAHAWPEVYFPGLGWVEFEPTVSEDPIRRPLGEIETEDGGRLRVPPGGDTEDRWRERLADLEGMDELAPGEGVTASSGESWFTTRQLIGMGLGALGLAVLVLAVRARRRGRMPALPVLVELGMKRIGWRPPDFLRRWAHRARMTSMERAYAEIDRSLERLGAAAGPADTAAERAAALTRLLPDGSSMVSILLDHYQAAIYGRRTVKDEGIEDAAHALRRLAWRRRLIRLLGRA
jgi:transglutaminase-like putative cysteine protease